MSADQVRHVMGRSGNRWRGPRVPPVWWSYPTPFMSDGTVMVFFNSDGTVQNTVFPKATIQASAANPEQQALAQ